eukprot:1148692-Pelagomonas_calceolata.AAC.5
MHFTLKVMRNTLYKAYLDDFAKFCQSLGGTTSEVMGDLLAFEALAYADTDRFHPHPLQVRSHCGRASKKCSSWGGGGGGDLSSLVKTLVASRTFEQGHSQYQLQPSHEVMRLGYHSILHACTHGQHPFHICADGPTSTEHHAEQHRHRVISRRQEEAVLQLWATLPPWPQRAVHG